MNTTLLSQKQTRFKILVINSTGINSLAGLIFTAVLITLLLAFNKSIFSTLLVLGFGAYGIYSLGRHDYSSWFSVICFFCGAESILRNGLPSAYMFVFYYLVGSGFLFLFTHAPHQRFKIVSATGFVLLLALLHFIHVDLSEIRFGLGKWGLTWLGLFFGMWISQSVKLNIDFYSGIWYYMLGAMILLFSFLLTPHYYEGRYWPSFDGTGPVAMAIGLLVLILVQHINPKILLSATNVMLALILVLCIGALVMLGSRGTFLGIALATVFFFFTMRGFWNKFLIGLLIAAMGWLIYYVDQSAIGNKVLSTRVEQVTEEDTREARKFINSAVLLAFPESPVIGKGTGSWRHYNNKYITAVFDKRYPKDLMMADAHNTAFHLLFEHGLIGAGLFLIAVFFLLIRSYMLSKHTGIFVFPLMIFSITLGLTTMHKQAPMFLPFLLAIAHLSFNQEKS